MSLKSFIWDTISEGKNPSSKRVAGCLGWLVCLFVIVYCTLNVIPAPEIAEVFMICTVALLGVDSITGIFKKPNSDIKSKLDQINSKITQTENGRNSGQ